jgi:hypothetical protein
MTVLQGEPDVRNVNDCAQLQAPEGENADFDSPCFSLSPDDSSRSVTEERAECTRWGRVPDAAAAEVEIALAHALERAAEAGRFDVVLQRASSRRGDARFGVVVRLAVRQSGAREFSRVREVASTAPHASKRSLDGRGSRMERGIGRAGTTYEPGDSNGHPG